MLRRLLIRPPCPYYGVQVTKTLGNNRVSIRELRLITSNELPQACSDDFARVSIGMNLQARICLGRCRPGGVVSAQSPLRRRRRPDAGGSVARLPLASCHRPLFHITPLQCAVLPPCISSLPALIDAARRSDDAAPLAAARCHLPSSLSRSARRRRATPRSLSTS